jgi:hypothetical protein
VESLAGQTYMADDGRRLVMDWLLKSGGAGGVYSIRTAPGEVAKLYHRNVDLALYERKVSAMLRLQPRVQAGPAGQVQLAWPTHLLRDPAGRFRGFTMPQLDVARTSDLEHVLLERQARAQRLPTGLGAKVTLAANLASVVAALHAERHYVVDLKPVNVRFYRDTLQIALLDCDGLSIQGAGERFPAHQVTPDYLAPEYQGVAVADEHQQDRFALAVVIFQLLNFGIHPYSGRPAAATLATDIPGRIKAGAYAYGVRGNRSILPNPGSGHLHFPSEIRSLFDRAFGTVAALRPQAAEWRNVLQTFALRGSGKLAACSRDSAHQHFAGMACAACERKALLARAARAPRRTPPARRPTAGLRPRAAAVAFPPRLPAAWPPPVAAAPSAAPVYGATIWQRSLVATAVPLAFAWMASWGFLLLWEIAPSPPQWRASALVLLLLLAFAWATLLAARGVPKAIRDPGWSGGNATLSAFVPISLGSAVQIALFAWVLWKEPNLWTLAAAALSPGESGVPAQPGTLLAAEEFGVGCFRLALLIAAVPCTVALLRHCVARSAGVGLLAGSVALLVAAGAVVKPPLVPQIVLIRDAPRVASMTSARSAVETPPASTAPRAPPASTPSVNPRDPADSRSATGSRRELQALMPIELPAIGRAAGDAAQATRGETTEEALARAVRMGVLRRGGQNDVERWTRRRGARQQASSGHTRHMHVYILVRTLELPPQLGGANAVVFIREPGAPLPVGELGHSVVLDMANGTCTGVTCELIDGP